MANRKLRTRAFKIRALRRSILALALVLSALASAQQIPDVAQIKWKSDAEIRVLLGEPQSVTGPIGSHASYTLWKYPDFTVAFANQRVIHVFSKDSLREQRNTEPEQP